MASRKWTPEEDEKLISMYETHRAKDVAEALDRSLGNVYSRIAYLRRKGKHTVHKHYDETTVFEVYKGTEVIAKGTSSELATLFNVAPIMITDWATPSRVERGQRTGASTKWAKVVKHE